MVIKTFGKLFLEGSDFKRRKPLLLLSYLSLAGEQSRRDLVNLFYNAEFYKEPFESLGAELRRLRKELPEAIRFDKTSASCALTTDAQELRKAFNSGEFENVYELYAGLFLESATLKGTSSGLQEWLEEQRFDYAKMFIQAALHLALLEKLDSNLLQVKNYADKACEVFLERSLLDTPDIDEAHFQKETLLLLQGFLHLVQSQNLKEFEMAAAVYEGFEVATSRDEALAALEIQIRHNLKPDDSFIGRTTESTDIIKLLKKKKKFVTLLGMGGVGKTMLAIQVGQTLLEQSSFRGGIYFISLEAIDSETEFLNHLYDVINLEDTIVEGVELETIVDIVFGLEMLLILDNFEHITELASIVSVLIENCPQLRILVTSRESLASKYEVVYPLSGLEIPNKEIAFDEGQYYSAISFFSRTAQNRKSSFVLDESSYVAVRELCAVTEGIPLVLELAANSIDLLPLPILLEKLNTDLTLLSKHSSDLPKRQQSMQLVWNYSWERLSKTEQKLLTNLTIFQGGFTFSAAEAIASADTKLLRTLIDKSLLRVSDSYRYSFHLTLLQFAREKKTIAKDLREKWIQYYLNQLQHYGKIIDGEAAQDAMTFFDTEGANIRATWQSLKDVEKLLKVVTGLEAYQERRGLWTERLTLIDHVRSLTQDGNSEVLTKLGNASAAIYANQGDLQKAYDLLIVSIELQTKDSELKAETYNELGGIHYVRREFEEAITNFESALDIYQLLGNIREEGNVLNNIAATYYLQGDFENAIAIWRNTLELQRKHGNLEQQARILNNVGSTYKTQGQLEEALTYLESASAIRSELGDERGLLVTNINIGSIFFQQGNFKQSLEINQGVLAAQKKQKDQLGIASTLNNIAMIYERCDNLELALNLLQEALYIQEKLDDKTKRAITLYNLSTVNLGLGNIERALVRAQQGLELSEETNNPISKGFSLLFLANALAAKEQFDEAINTYNNAIIVQENTNDKEGLIMSLNGLATMQINIGDFESALESAQRSVALAENLGCQFDAYQGHLLLSKIYGIIGDDTAINTHATRAATLSKTFQRVKIAL